MSFAETTETAVPVADVFAMNDASLDQFIQNHRLPNGNYDLPVDGWAELSKEDRNRLASRLVEAQQNRLAESPHALDLDDLDTRLRQISPNESFSLKVSPEELDQDGDCTPPLDITMAEVDAYHDLVNDDGRPLFPVEIIHDVYENPDNYTETLRPWQETLTEVHHYDIFGTQLQHWQDFRKWQNDNRGREDDDGGFLGFVQKRELWIKRSEPEHYAAKSIAKMKSDLPGLQRNWDQVQYERGRLRRWCREQGCHGLQEYSEAIKARLARHGFTMPFHLEEDPQKQDKLTTWIEYLGYEYWWLDKYISNIERLQPEYDKLWQDLVDENILRPHETREYLQTDESAMEATSDEDLAYRAVKRAEAETTRVRLSKQRGDKCGAITKAKQMSTPKAIKQKVLEAKQRLKETQHRNRRVWDYCRACCPYFEAKRNAERHRTLLLPWVLAQVPLIEAEMEESKSDETEL